MPRRSFQETLYGPRNQRWPLILTSALFLVCNRVCSGFIVLTPRFQIRRGYRGHGTSRSGLGEPQRHLTLMTMAPKEKRGRIKPRQKLRSVAVNATLVLDNEANARSSPTTVKDSPHGRVLSRLEDMHEKLKKGENLTQAYCDNVLASCIASDEWDSVLDVLDVMNRQGFSQGRSTYRACFQTCFEAGNGASAREMLSAMRQALITPDSTDISLVVAAMCRNENTESGWWRKALSLLRTTAEEVQRGNRPVPVEAYDAVLIAMTPHQWKESLRLLRQMEAASEDPDQPPFHPRPTLSTYRIVIGNCVGASQTEPACQVLLGMPRKRMTPTVYTFELLISALSRKLQWRRALQLLEVMDELDIQKTVFTYNTIISACAKAKEVGTAKSLLVRMRKQGVKPNVVTFNSLISAFASTSRWKDALSTLDQCHREPGVQPDIISYTNAMRACARGGKTNSALVLLEVVKDKKLPIDTYCYTAVIDACAKGKLWKKALELLEEMENNGVRANEVTYSCSISACGNAGQWQKAVELLQSMKAKRMKVNLITYNAVITALAKASKRNANKRQAVPHARLDSAPKDADLRRRDLDQLYVRALELLHEMKADGITPDGFSYSAAISCCGSGGRWEEALELISKMKKGGPKTRPNRVSYTAAIAACGRAGKYEHALRLFEDMEEEGLQPDRVSWNAIFSALRVANMTDTSYEYWRAMCGKTQSQYHKRQDKRRTHVSPDIVTVTDVLSTLIRSNKPIHVQRADEVFEDAVARGILMRQGTLDSTCEVDLSGMAFPVARAACRFVLRRALAMSSAGTEVSDVSFITGVGRAKTARDYLMENVRTADADRLRGEQPGKARPAATGTALREYVQQVLLQDFEPSIMAFVPKRAQGTVVVPGIVVQDWIAKQL